MRRERGDIAAIVVRAGVTAAAQAGLDLQPVFSPQELAALTGLSRRVPWERFVLLAEAVDEACAGAEGGYERFARRFFENSPEFDALAALVDPEDLFRLILAMGSWAYLPVTQRSKRMGDTLIIHLDLRPGFRPCEAYFRVLAHGFQYGPCTIGHRPYPVEVALRPAGATYQVRLPPRVGLRGRGRKALKGLRTEALAWLMAAGGELQELWSRAGSPEEPDPLWSEQAWRLTRREAAVLGWIVQGRSNKEIAAALGCAPRTIEIHVSRILRKSGSRSRAELIARHFRGE